MVEENGKVIATNFCELGLETEYVKGIESPISETYFFNLKYISQYNERNIKSLLEKIAVYHHTNMTFEKTSEAHFKVVRNKERERLYLNQIKEIDKVAIGIDNENRKVILDFNKTPHLLIAGTTGSGKSVLVKNIITNLINVYDSKTLQLLLIDPKGTELNKFKGVGKTTFIDNTKQAIATLKKCETIMDNRYKYPNQRYTELFIVIDELADLMLTSKYEVEESLVRIAQKGRACGMHLIVATQRPSVDVCTGLIKANMPTRIALKTASVRDSIVILDRKGAEQLLGNGDAILKEGGNETRLQVAI